MAIELSLKVIPGGYELVDAAGEELHEEYPRGMIVRAKVTRPVNPKFRRKWFALLQVLFPHQDLYPTFELFRKAMQRACGYMEVVTVDGVQNIFDVSISWSSMDDHEFKGLYERTLILAETSIIPGIARQDVIDRWNDILIGYADAEDSHGARKTD